MSVVMPLLKKQTRLTNRQIVSELRKKCINPYAIYNFPHAGSLSKRYSDEAISEAIRLFPSDCKVLEPVPFLEGIIKILCTKTALNTVADRNKCIAEKISALIKEICENEELN